MKVGRWNVVNVARSRQGRGCLAVIWERLRTDNDYTISRSSQLRGYVRGLQKYTAIAPNRGRIKARDEAGQDDATPVLQG